MRTGGRVARGSAIDQWQEKAAQGGSDQLDCNPLRLDDVDRISERRERTRECRAVAAGDGGKTAQPETDVSGCVAWLAFSEARRIRTIRVP